jgi:hypothetical protein
MLVPVTAAIDLKPPTTSKAWACFQILGTPVAHIHILGDSGNTSKAYIQVPPCCSGSQPTNATPSILAAMLDEQAETLPFFEQGSVLCTTFPIGISLFFFVFLGCMIIATNFYMG